MTMYTSMSQDEHAQVASLPSLLSFFLRLIAFGLLTIIIMTMIAQLLPETGSFPFLIWTYSYMAFILIYTHKQKKKGEKKK